MTTIDVTPDGWGFMNVEPSHNWRPGRPMTARKDVRHTITGAWSMLRSAARRDSFDLPDLRTLADTADALDDALLLGVRNLRERGASWTDIGNAMGTSRVSAYQRWADRLEDEEVPA